VSKKPCPPGYLGQWPNGTWYCTKGPGYFAGLGDEYPLRKGAYPWAGALALTVAPAVVTGGIAFALARKSPHRVAWTIGGAVAGPVALYALALAFFGAKGS
jgi:hypothetical protein